MSSERPYWIFKAHPKDEHGCPLDVVNGQPLDSLRTFGDVVNGRLEIH